jgi:iron complex outermembrane receptor protein
MRKLAALAALCAAGPAVAQSPQRLPTLTVTASPPAEALTAPSLEAAQETVARTPGGAAVVPADAYRDGRAVNVRDVLNFVPGVFAQPKYGQEDARLSIRGSGLSRNFHVRGIRLLLDGVPINLADGSGDFHEIDPLAASYAEAYKGANALAFGAASLGGAVNFVSPTGLDAPGWLLRGELGSFDTQRGQLAYGGAEGPWDWFATPTWSASDGFRDHSEQEFERFNGNVGYRFSPDAETRFFAGYNHLDQDIPSSVSRTTALTTPEATDPTSFSRDTERDVTSRRFSNRTAFFVGDVQATISAYVVDKDLYHPLAFGIIDQEYRGYGGTARALGEGELLGLPNQLLIGANLDSGNNDAKLFVNQQGQRGALFADADELSLNLDLYAEDRLRVTPTVTLVLGGQVNYADRELKDAFLTNGDDSGHESFTSLNPKIGALWDYAPGQTAFANLSRSSEPPTFSELNPSATPGFADLEPQTAVTAEVGGRGEVGRFAWDASLYRAWVKDELQLFVVPGSGASGFALNADRTIHQGVELGLGVELPENLKLRLAYTFSDFRFDGDPAFGDNELPGAPRHYLVAELRWEQPSGFYAGPNVEWVPEAYYVDNANTLKTEAYAILGAKAGWRFENGLSIFLDARNLTDEAYISNVGVVPVATPGAALFNPGDGRSLFVGAEWRW